MGRGARGAKTKLTTSEARRSLPALAREAARRDRPSERLLDHAVEIQPRGEGRSAYLVPEVDIEAAQRRIKALEEELEDIALVRMLEQRAAADTGNLTHVDDVIRDLGLDELLS
ncbi:MAG: hypothetical protein LT070_13405 [Solirubrobacteraceae bacterium]|nr:hypothetical protein [Solirubrobacteraceae bacterium]